MHRLLTAEEIPEWELEEMIREVMLLAELSRCRIGRADLKKGARFGGTGVRRDLVHEARQLSRCSWGLE
jgi:hypothetical protein